MLIGTAPSLGSRLRGNEWIMSAHHYPQRAVKRAEHPIQLLASTQDVSGRRNNAVGAMAARQLGIFFDAVDRNFAGAAEHRENRAIFEEIDGVIAPLAGRNLAAIKPQEPVELAAAERHFVSGDARTMLVPAPRAWIDFAEIHGGASCLIEPDPQAHVHPCHLCVMIAPEPRGGKPSRVR